MEILKEQSITATALFLEDRYREIVDDLTRHQTTVEFALNNLATDIHSDLVQTNSLIYNALVFTNLDDFELVSEENLKDRLKLHTAGKKMTNAVNQKPQYKKRLLNDQASPYIYVILDRNGQISMQLSTYLAFFKQIKQNLSNLSDRLIQKYDFQIEKVES